MSEQEQTSVVPASNYTPIANREQTGTLREDRPEFQRAADSKWQPVFPAKSPDQERIEQLEKQVANDNKQAEYNALKTPAEKELFALRERESARDAASKAERVQQERLEQYAQPLQRLNQLQVEIASDGERSMSELVAVQQAIKQFSCVGGCERTAERMLRDIEKNESERTSTIFGEKLKRQATLRAELRELDSEVEADSQSFYSDDDRQYMAARKEWQAAEQAGDVATAQQLRSTYWHQRAARKV